MKLNTFRGRSRIKPSQQLCYSFMYVPYPSVFNIMDAFDTRCCNKSIFCLMWACSTTKSLIHVYIYIVHILSYSQFCRCVQDVCQDEEDQQGRLLSPSKKKNVLTEKSLQRTVAKLQCWKQDQDSLQVILAIPTCGVRGVPVICWGFKAVLKDLCSQEDFLLNRLYSCWQN